MVSLLAYGLYYSLAGLLAAVLSIIASNKSGEHIETYRTSWAVKNRIRDQEEFMKRQREREARNARAEQLERQALPPANKAEKKKQRKEAVQRKINESPRTVQPEEFFDVQRTE